MKSWHNLQVLMRRGGDWNTHNIVDKEKMRWEWLDSNGADGNRNEEYKSWVM